MRTFDGIQVKDYITYKKAYLPLSKYPIIIVRGLNKDSRPPQPNGAGKSLLLSAIQTVGYAQAPMALKKNTAKDFHIKGSLIDLTMRDENNAWSLQQYGKASGAGYRVLRDGEDLKFREIKSAQAKIREVMPWNLEQFTSQIYLNRDVPNLLQKGSGTQRHEMFENIFDLHDYDYIYDRVKPKLNSARLAKNVYNEIRNTQLVGKFLKLNPDIIKKDISHYSNLIEKINVQVNTLQEKLRRVELYLHLSRDLHPDLTLDATKLAGLIEKYSKRLQANERTARIQSALVEQWKAYENFKAQKHRLEKELEGSAVGKIDTAELKAKITRYSEQRTTLQNKISRAKERLSLFSQFRSGRERINSYFAKKLDSNKYLPKWARSSDDFLHNASRIRENIFSRREQLSDRLRGLRDSSGECKLCGNPLTDKQHKKLFTQTKNELIWIKNHEEFFIYVGRFSQLAEKIGDDKEINISALERKKKKIETKSSKAQSLLDQQRKRKLIEEQLDNLEKVTKPDRKVDTETDYEKIIVSARTNLELVQTQQNTLQKLSKLKTTFPNAKIAKKNKEKLDARLVTLHERLNKAQKKLNDFRVEYHRLKDQIKQQKRMTKTLREKRKLAKLLPMYEALAEAYGPRGLRVDHIRKIAEQYTENMTDNARSIYNEPFVFSAQVENREFNILAQRGGKTSDVRYLCGYESRAFALLSVLSLLPLLPSHLRSNLIVLDEMESGLSKESRRLFASEFIPQLNKIVPNIVIVTPLSAEELYIPNAHTVTAVKHNSISRLENK